MFELQKPKRMLNLTWVVLNNEKLVDCQCNIRSIDYGSDLSISILLSLWQMAGCGSTAGVCPWRYKGLALLVRVNPNRLARFAWVAGNVYAPVWAKHNSAMRTHAFSVHASQLWCVCPVVCDNCSRFAENVLIVYNRQQVMLGISLLQMPAWSVSQTCQGQHIAHVGRVNTNTTMQGDHAQCRYTPAVDCDMSMAHNLPGCRHSWR